MLNRSVNTLLIVVPWHDKAATGFPVSRGGFFLFGDMPTISDAFCVPSQ